MQAKTRTSGRFQSVIVKGYSVTDEIGAGSFGIVYKGTRSNETFALKELYPEHGCNGDFCITNSQEYLRLVGLQHTNVITLKDRFFATSLYGPIALRQFLVFEYCPCTLLQLVKDRRIKFMLEDVKGMFQQILKGLQYIHSKGIIHRDLKPDNILIDGKGILKVADFGSAVESCLRKRRAAYHSKYVVSRWYRPPEVLMKKPYDCKVDIWSAGCVLAEICIGEVVYRGENAEDQLQRIFHSSVNCIGLQLPRHLRGTNRLTDWFCFDIPDIRRMFMKSYPQQDMQRMFDFLLHGFKVRDFSIQLTLWRTLIIDPEKRPTAETLLKDPFFADATIPRNLQHLLHQYKLNVRMLEDI